MGIFDVFTGSPAKKAAEQTRAFLDKTKTANEGVIDTGLSTSLASLGRGYDTATGAINTGYGDAQGFLTGGADRARAAYDPLAALGGKYGGATSMALNALGVNGQPGMETARGAFEAGPGYGFVRDQGLDAINRRRNAGGMLNSGNADRDAQVFGSGIASQEYDKWLGNLLGFTSPELAATSGTATGRAGIESTLGQNQAGLATGQGASLADLSRWLASGEAGLNTNAATAKVGNANTMIQPYTGSYKQEADAQMQGSGNLWNLGLNLAKLGVGAFAGGMPSFGGGNPSSAAFGSNPFTPSGAVNPAYTQYG